MRNITIPKRFGYPTVDITINGKEQTFNSGVEISVEDSVAAAIENAIALEPKTSVPRNMFARYIEGSLEEITAEDLAGISTIRACAVYSCLSLKRVTIPSNIKKISNNAFDWCSFMESVYLPETPPELMNINAFTNLKCKFYCKSQASLEAYKKATNWSTLTGTHSFVVEESKNG